MDTSVISRYQMSDCQNSGYNTFLTPLFCCFKVSHFEKNVFLLHLSVNLDDRINITLILKAAIISVFIMELYQMTQ